MSSILLTCVAVYSLLNDDYVIVKDDYSVDNGKYCNLLIFNLGFSALLGRKLKHNSILFIHTN